MAKKESEKPARQTAAKNSLAQESSQEEFLSDEALDDVSGGMTNVPHDVASGLPTGKRMHKPFEAASA